MRYAATKVGVVRLGKGNHGDLVAKLRAALDAAR